MADSVYASQGINTKMRIVASLGELCEDSSYDQVNIMQICDKSDISRSTFYHHFHDKNAILQWHSSLSYEMGIDQIGRTLPWFEGHLITTVILEKYLTLYYRAGFSQEYSGVRPSFVRNREKSLTETITKWHRIEMTDQLGFQVKATAALESSMANLRYSGENTMPPEQYCQQLVNALPRAIFEILDKPTDPAEKNSTFLLLRSLI